MRTRLSRSTCAFLLADGARRQGGSGTASLLILAAGSAVPLTPSLMTHAPRRRKPSTTGGRNGTAPVGGDPLRSMIDVLQPQRSRYRDTWPFTFRSPRVLNASQGLASTCIVAGQRHDPES